MSAPEAFSSRGQQGSLESNRGARPRQSHSCQACRLRKIRCSKTRPVCDRCARDGTQCVYDDGAEARRTFRFVPSSIGANPISRTSSAPRDSSSEDISARQSLPGLSSTAPSAVPQPSLIAVSEARLQSMETLLQSLNDKVHSLRGKTPVLQPQTTAPGGANGVGQLTDRIGYLSMHGDGQTRYVDETFWASTCDEAYELDRLLRSSEIQPAAEISGGDPSDWEDDSVNYVEGDLLSSAPAFPSTRSRHRTRTLSLRASSILAALPSKAQSDVLLRAYINWHHSLVPLFHLGSFLDRYRVAWTADTSSPDQVAFLSLLASTLFAGAIVCPEADLARAFPGVDPTVLQTRLRKDAIRAVRRADFPAAATLESFTAYLLCQITWMRDEEPLSCCAFIGLCVRVAQRLGLHRDPSTFEFIDPVNAEIRRRLWWDVLHLDTEVAIASGLPVIFSGTNQVRPVSELKERFLGTPEGLQYDQAVATGRRQPDSTDDTGMSSRTSMVSTVGITFAAKMRATEVARTIIFRINETVLHEEDLQEIFAQLDSLKAELSRYSERLTFETAAAPGSGIDTSPAPSDYETNPILNKWYRTHLSVLGDKLWCLVSSAVMRAGPRNDQSLIYQQLIQHCGLFLQKVVYLSCAEDDFTHFQWTWPGVHQPLSAMIVLLRDITNFPQSARSTSLQQIVSQAFSLCGPDGGIVGGGESAQTPRPLAEAGTNTWTLLWRLRSKAWQAAGLDPNEHWSRGQGIRVARERYRVGYALQEAVDFGQQVPPNLQQAQETLGPDWTGASGDQFMTDIDWTEFNDAFGGGNIFDPTLESIFPDPGSS